jgi:hypothetical protein
VIVYPWRSSGRRFYRHLNDEIARYILGRVEPSDDSVGALEIRFSDDHTAHLVFKFAEQLVSQALFIDRGERDHCEYSTRVGRSSPTRCATARTRHRF